MVFRLTILLGLTKRRRRHHTIAHPCVRQHLHAVVGEFAQITEHNGERCGFACIDVIVGESQVVHHLLKVEFVTLQ